jgi:hypothetical protein
VIRRAAARGCQANQSRGRPQADKPPSARHQPFPPSQPVGLPKRIGPPQQEVHPHQRAHSRQRWKVSPTSFRQLAVMAENLSRRPCSFLGMRGNPAGVPPVACGQGIRDSLLRQGRGLRQWPTADDGRRTMDIEGACSMKWNEARRTTDGGRRRKANGGPRTGDGERMTDDRR